MNNDFMSFLNLGLKRKESINNKIDLTLPMALWDLEKTDFISEKTTLTELYNKKMEISKVEDKIELENNVLENKLKEIKAKYIRDIDVITTNLVKEKDLKRQYYEKCIEDIQRRRSDAITDAKQYCKDETNRRILEKEAEYKSTLQKYHSIIERSLTLLTTYGKNIDTHTDKKVSSEKIKDISYIQLQDALDSIETRIMYILESNMVIDKGFKSIKGMNKSKTNKTAALTMATAFLNPIAPILGAGVVIGTSVIGSNTAKSKIVKELENVLYIYWISKAKYNIAYKDNKINIAGLDEERDEKIARAENIYNKEIEDIKNEKDTWAKDYQERCARDYVKEFLEKSDIEMSQAADISRNLIHQYELKLNQLREEYNVLESNIKEKNSKKPVVDLKSEEIFKRLSESKKIVDDFNMYEILKGLKYDEKIEYDKKLKYEELGKLEDKLKPYIKNGQGKQYWVDKKKSISEEEDKYYLATTDGLHLGRMNQPEKYGILTQGQEIFSENWDNKSILVFYNNNVEESILCEYVKYLVLQMVGKTGADSITVNIVNPTMDIKFNDILLSPTKTDKTGKVEKLKDIIVNQSGDSLDDFKVYTKKYIKRLVDNDLSGGKTFHSIIKEKRSRESKCPGMILNILHRCDNTDELIEFNENSSTTGVVNICLLRNDILRERKLDNGVNETYIESDIKFYLEKTELMMYINPNTSNKILNIVRKDGKYTQIILDKQYIDTQATIKDLTERYKRARKNKTFTLIDEYINHIIPADQVWKGDASESLMLNFGYVDGDKSKPYPIILDETAFVHMLLCGTTGGGKSVSLDTMINVLKMRYAPSQLEIFYYDFKKVGVATHALPYKWANASALSASENGDYIISVLEKLVEIQNERYSMCEALHVSKLSELQREIRKKKEQLIDKGMYDLASQIEVPARILLIIDEFQSAFDISDEVSEKVKWAMKELSTKARAAGIHMLIITQDPANTKIPESVFNLFTTRVCTKAQKSVSQSVLRNDFASRPENQFVGFLGANITNGTEEGNIQFVVPFTKPEMNNLYSKISNDMANDPNTPKENRSRDAIWFSDDEKVNYKNLDAYMDKYYKESGDIVLGKKIQYQREDIPYILHLNKDTSQNISYISSSKEDKAEFYKTVMKSIAKDDNAEVLTMFTKEYEKEYDTDNLTKKTTMKCQIYVNKKTGRILRNPWEIEEMSEEIQTSGEWEDKLIDISHLDDRYYTQMVTSRLDERTDESFNSWYTQILEAKIEKARNARKEGILAPRVYIIIVEPERDPYVVPERLWNSREMKQLMNEAATYGIHSIVITSKFYQMADMDVFTYKLGKAVGEEAGNDKTFKKLEEGVTKVNNMVNIKLSKKILMPTEQKGKKYLWDVA